jgi:hypothetical protein
MPAKIVIDIYIAPNTQFAQNSSGFNTFDRIMLISRQYGSGDIQFLIA